MVGNNTTPPGKNDTVVTQVLNWAAGQPFNNVLLLAIFASICWIAHFAITVAIPKHLQQIQDGYEKIDQGHERGRQRDIEIYDRWFNRMEERLNNTGGTKSGAVKTERPNLGEMRSNSKRLPQAEGIALVQPIGYQVAITTPEGRTMAWERTRTNGMYRPVVPNRRASWLGGSGQYGDERAGAALFVPCQRSDSARGGIHHMHRERESGGDPESRIIWRPIEAESGGGSDF
jgi:hypothetical protein